MSNWFGQVLDRADSVNDWLSPKRQSSLALLKERQWPTRKTEDWKYTPLHALDTFESGLPAANEAAPSEFIADLAIAGLDSIDLIFVDGVLQSAAVLDELPEGLSIYSLPDLPEGKQSDVLGDFAAIKPERHLFGLINDVLATQGLVIEVAAGATILQPIRIVSAINNSTEAHTRLQVKLGESSSLAVIEQYVGNDACFNTGVAEYDVADNAQLEHYRFALQTSAAMVVGGSHFKLGNRSRLNSTVVGFGSQLSRVDVDVHHAGEYAEAKLNAIYLLDNNELFDLHSTIEHAVPHCITEENVRGIVADKARAVFNGRIHIHRDAQKTLAELNNRNLLMSNEAEVNTKPELEIYADDVRCAHGATVAEIDKSGLYYLQSRGISRAQAQVMLSFGFINELVDQMPNQILAEWLRPQLRERFANMDVK